MTPSDEQRRALEWFNRLLISLNQNVGDPSDFDSACVKTIRAALSQPEPEVWQPIESAPRDERTFVGYSPSHGISANVRWSNVRKDFDENGFSSLARDWTHWMPLPAPPLALLAGDE